MTQNEYTPPHEHPNLPRSMSKRQRLQIVDWVIIIVAAVSITAVLYL